MMMLRGRRRVGAFACAALLMVACGTEQSPTIVRDEVPTIDGVIDVIMAGPPSATDKAYLARATADTWAAVGQFFRDNPGISEYVNSEAGSTEPLSSMVVCSWDGTTERDWIECVAHNWDFQGHNAVFFIVDGPADCYDKNVKPGWASCSPGSGCVNTWLLQCTDSGCPWFYSAQLGKWVKKVHLIVPTAWWNVLYFYLTADTKSLAFLLSWNDTRTTGCCD